MGIQYVWWITILFLLLQAIITLGLAATAMALGRLRWRVSAGAARRGGHSVLPSSWRFAWVYVPVVCVILLPILWPAGARVVGPLAIPLAREQSGGGAR